PRQIRRRLSSQQLVQSGQACPEHKDSISKGCTKEPIMNIPENFHCKAIYQNSVIPPELPSQPIHLHHCFAVYANYKARITNTCSVTLNHNVMNLAIVTKYSSGTIQLLTKNMLFLGNQKCIVG
ncbi:hypothetical protein V8G54_032460, partial [Vigna mungo]